MREQSFLAAAFNRLEPPYLESRNSIFSNSRIHIHMASQFIALLYFSNDDNYLQTSMHLTTSAALIIIPSQ